MYERAVWRKGGFLIEDCVFCKIIKKEIPAEIVYEDDFAIAFKDINPVARIHYLIMPKKHIPTVLDIQDGEEKIIGHIQTVAAKIARSVLDGKGFRMVVNCLEDAGQKVFHIHYHFLAGPYLKRDPV